MVMLVSIWVMDVLCKESGSLESVWLEEKEQGCVHISQTSVLWICLSLEVMRKSHKFPKNKVNWILPWIGKASSYYAY